MTAVQCVHVRVHASEHPNKDSTFYGKNNSWIIIVFICSQRYHVRRPPPYYIQPMPKPRFDFSELNKERLKKISLSATSLPPVPLFPTESKADKIPSITDEAFASHNFEDIHDDMYNFYDEEMVRESRHHSLEYLDDFYPIEDEHLLDNPFDDIDVYAGAPPLTATTTITSFKCQTNIQQTQSVTNYQTHNRASSL